MSSLERKSELSLQILALYIHNNIPLDVELRDYLMGNVVDYIKES